MDDRFAAAVRLLPEYLSQHVLLSAAALTLGLIISLPLVVAASRRPGIRWPVLGAASLIQSVPGLALLAAFYPLLLALSSLSQHLFGHGFSALGFLPSLLALTLYSMLPIVRNGVTALLNIDPAVIEAADAVGMTDRQRLLRIELPLSAPLLMAGIRTSTVWVIGTATLATPAGQATLGNYIFSGLQLEDWVSVLFGCVAAAALTLLADQILGLIEAGVSGHRPGRVSSGVVLLLVGVVAAAAVPLASGVKSAYVIGAKNFSEQYILAALMADRLEKEGFHATVRSDLGSAVVFRALANGEIDAYVDYSGTLWANVLGRADRVSRELMLQEMRTLLRKERGVVLVGPLGFENAYALAMRRDRAAALGIHSIVDLVQQAPSLRMGGDLEFFARPEWKELRREYGLTFREQRQFQPTFMYNAVADGEVDVISAFSSDGRIEAYNLEVLSDPRHVIPPYDAVVLVSPERAYDPALRRAFAPLVGSIPIERMRQANFMVDRDAGKVSPDKAARWLEDAVHLD